MDVLDAGVFVAKWEAEVPKGVRTVLWGPLQARGMGFDGWEWQDGGETGMVAHRPHMRLSTGHATASLIVVDRLRRAFLTVYLAGYPADAPPALRRADQQRLVAPAEAFLGRLAGEPVRFTFQGELALVDNVNDAAVAAAPTAGGERLLGGGRLTARRPSGPVEEA